MKIVVRAALGAIGLLSILLWSPVLPAQANSRFRRGDANLDGTLDTADPVSLLGYLYLRSAAPSCMDAADANDDGRLDMSDAVFILQFLLGGGGAPKSPWPGCGLDPTPDSLGCAVYEEGGRKPCAEGSRDTIEETLHFLTNRERSSVGLPPLKRNPLLARAMQDHLVDMAANDYFSHTSLDGSLLTDRIDAVGYKWQSVGENIAAGYLTPETTIAGWMASPSHRANLLSSKFREAGMSHVFDASSFYLHYWGQDFGTQSAFFPVVINLEAPTTSVVKVSLYVYGEGWAVDMQVSNDASFVGAAWQPYRPNLEWTLKTGLGVKTVFVKLRKGNEVRTADDSILLVQQ